MPAVVRDLSPLWAFLMFLAVLIVAASPERAEQVVVSAITAVVYSALGWGLRR